MRPLQNMEKNKETFEIISKSISLEELKRAKEGFEYLARRLDELWMKESLTLEEEKEVQLILNNASVILEIIEGKIPEELKGYK